MPKGIGYGPKKLKRKKHSPAGEKHLKRGRHSKAGAEYREHGDIEGVQELHKTRQKTARLKRKVAEGDKPKVITVGKPNEHKISSSTSGGPPSYAAWLKKTGKGATVATSRQWRQVVKNWGAN